MSGLTAVSGLAAVSGRAAVSGGRLTVLLLPGIGGDAAEWGPVAARLDGRLDGRLCVEARGLPVGPDSVDGLAAAVAMPAGPVLLVGLSLGALVGRALRGRPGVVGLVGLGALPGPARRPRGLGAAARLVGALPAGAGAAWMRRRVRARLREEGVEDGLAAEILRGLPPPAVWAARLRAVAGWAPGPLPSGPPVWWWRGQVDREAPWSLAEAAADLPGARVETVEGGHRAPLTHPGALAERILQVAAGCGPTR